MKNLHYKWSPALGLWDCTDGEIHGGGKTKELALEDYRRALAAERFDATVGWSG